MLRMSLMDLCLQWRRDGGSLRYENVEYSDVAKGMVKAWQSSVPIGWINHRPVFSSGRVLHEKKTANTWEHFPWKGKKYLSRIPNGYLIARKTDRLNMSSTSLGRVMALTALSVELLELDALTSCWHLAKTQRSIQFASGCKKTIAGYFSYSSCYYCFEM
jgi:hypothetical protein